MRVRVFLCLVCALSVAAAGAARSQSSFTINVWDSTAAAAAAGGGAGNKSENNPSPTVKRKVDIRTNVSTSSSSSSSKSSPTTSGNGGIKKPLLTSLVNKLESLSSKLDSLASAQIQIQKSFDSLENRVTEDNPGQCGRRVDRVLSSLNPLVSRLEGLWNAVAGGGGAKGGLQPTFLGAPPNDILLSESRRQERAITGIRSDFNLRTQQIISELGTVESQLDNLQANLRLPTSPPPAPAPVDPVVDVVLGSDLNNDVTLEPAWNPANGSRPGLVFPSVRNKPSSDSLAVDGAEALLTGSGQTGVSCAELIAQGNRKSGLYHLRLPGARSSFWQLLAFCEQESSGGGWMVIQRRADFGEPRESFHRNWLEYRSGFGDPVKELWMGNLNLHLLTSSEDQILRIELEDFDGEKRFAEYSTFKVASESDGFRLEVSGYSGDAGDALSDPWYGAHGSAFSTHDRDNDRSSLNCASMLKGGWWWKSCGRGLNGIYYDSPQPDSALARQGIVWFRWKGWDYTLRRATMMIRPKSFRPNATNY